MNILVTGARAPIAADLAKTLRLAGHHVWLLDSLRWPIAAGSPHIEGYLRMPAPRNAFGAFARGVVEACCCHRIDTIIPTSEEVFWLAALRRKLPARVNLRTSDLATLARLHDKAAFAEIASELGYGAAENRRLISGRDLRAFADPSAWVFKPVYSRFATRTLVGPTSVEVAQIEATPECPWLAQTRIRGDEYCLYNVAEKGRLLLHVAYAPKVRFGKGASIYFEAVEQSALRELSARFIGRTAFTGQISFDVMADGERLIAIECNPRGTSGVHLAAQSPVEFSAALLGESAALPSSSSMPRMLLGPWMLQSPGTLFRAGDRALRARARDALTAAEISPWRQTIAVAEMTWRAVAARTSVAAASTLDIEWNGEPLDG